MTRNRKNQAAAVKFGPALKALGLCLFLGGSGIGYVWQKDQINALNERRKQAEIRYERLRRDNEQLSRVLATMQSPFEIEAQIRQRELGLVAPQPDQIVRLVEPPPNVFTNGRERLYAAEPIRPEINR